IGQMKTRGAVRFRRRAAALLRKAMAWKRRRAGMWVHGYAVTCGRVTPVGVCPGRLGRAGRSRTAETAGAHGPDLRSRIGNQRPGDPGRLSTSPTNLMRLLLSRGDRT